MKEQQPSQNVLQNQCLAAFSTLFQIMITAKEDTGLHTALHLHIRKKGGETNPLIIFSQGTDLKPLSDFFSGFEPLPVLETMEKKLHSDRLYGKRTVRSV